MRLENMSWRLWNQQTLYCTPKYRDRVAATGSSSHNESSDSNQVSRKSSIPPALSSSVDSVTSEDFEDSDEDVDTMSGLERRRMENRITPYGLMTLVTSIADNQEVKEPLSLSLPQDLRRRLEDCHSMKTSQEKAAAQGASSPRPVNTQSATSTVVAATGNSISPSCSANTSLSDSSSHSIIRGFTTGSGVSSYRSQSQLATAPTPILKSNENGMTTRTGPSKKKTAMFMLGSSGEDDSSFPPHTSLHSHMNSTSQGLKRPPTSKKQTSFNEHNEIRTFQLPSDESDNAIETDEDTDDELEEISESAIEDDDDAWEDDLEEAKDEQKELRFHRVDSKPNLVSQRSMLTSGIHEHQRAAGLRNAASRSTPGMRRSRTSTPNGPSLAASPDGEMVLSGTRFQTSQPKPIILTTSNTNPPASSPRTTRREMLKDELSNSMRAQMLQERHQRNITWNAVLQRRHTSGDVKNLSHFPELGQADKANKKITPRIKETSNGPAWNNYFDQGLGEYHAKGW